MVMFCSMGPSRRAVRALTGSNFLVLGILLCLGSSHPSLAAAAERKAAPKTTAPRLSASQIVKKHVAARGGLEAWRAVQALSQAYTDFYSAVADYNRAQFRLYRALGHPAQVLGGGEPACLLPPVFNNR